MPDLATLGSDGLETSDAATFSVALTAADLAAESSSSSLSSSVKYLKICHK
jgi:hypothetical protein